MSLLMNFFTSTVLSLTISILLTVLISLSFNLSDASSLEVYVVTSTALTIGFFYFITSLDLD